MNTDCYTIQRQTWLSAQGRFDWEKQIGTWAGRILKGMSIVGLVCAALSQLDGIIYY